MTEEKDKSKGSEGYDDFLVHVSQFTSRDEEKAFMESIGQEAPLEDLEVNVGERVKSAREKRGLGLRDISRGTGMGTSPLPRTKRIATWSPFWSPCSPQRQKKKDLPMMVRNLFLS